MSKKITQEEVLKALASLDAELDEDVVKASEDDLDQPEGADLKPEKDHMKNKMSDDAPAPSNSPKPVKKGYNKSEEESEDEDEENEGEEMMEKKVKKSFTEDMPEEIETKIDVSEFLKSLVQHTGETIDSLSEYVAKSDKAHEKRYDQLADEVAEIQKSQAKIGLVLKAICEQIGVVKSAPARGPKSETVAKSTAVADRKFDSGLEEEKGEEKMFKSLSENPQVAKSQMTEALCDLVKGGFATDIDVITFESNGYVRPELVGKLKEKLN
jgi:uncharacterized membrane protein YheB (UPF0754 family)